MVSFFIIVIKNKKIKFYLLELSRNYWTKKPTLYKKKKNHEVRNSGTYQ